MKNSKNFLLLPFFALIFTVYTLINPLQCAYYVSKSIDVCRESLIPSLFPFMFLMKFYCETVTFDTRSSIPIRILSCLLGVPETLSKVTLLGMFAGFPSGAAAICTAYSRGLCTKVQAERVIAISDNCSAAFLISVCGVIVAGNAKYGFILLTAQLLAALTTAQLLKAVFGQSKEINIKSIGNPKKIKISEAFIASAKGSTMSMLYVCGFVIIFSFLSGIISDNAAKILAAGNANIETVKAIQIIIRGFFEMANGALNCGGLRYPINIIACSAVTGFAGISVYFQISGICEEQLLSAKQYLVSRLFMLFLSPIFTVIIMLILPYKVMCFSNNAAISQPVTTYYCGQIAKFSFITTAILLAVIILKKVMTVKNTEKKL